MQLAARLRTLPTTPVIDSERLIAQQRAHGSDVISLASSVPDLPPPPHVVAALIETPGGQASAHQLGPARGQPALRAAIARWHNRRYKVSLSPHSEVLPINGTKEGLAYVAWLVTNPGDLVLVPDPGYRLYTTAAELAGATVVAMPLLSQQDFLPDLKAIPPDIARRARLMYLNYPNNPTGATAPAQFYHEVVAFAKQYDIVVCQDMAFAGITYDSSRVLSFLEIPGAMDVGIEFHSLSMTYNMSDYRVGMAVGNKQLVEALANLKSVVGTPLPEAIQRAALAALDGTPADWFAQLNQKYARRRDLTLATLDQLGLRARKPRATPFVWAAVPPGQASLDFATRMLTTTGVWVVPGVGFGSRGEGYIRVSLCVADERLDDAMRRIAAVPVAPAELPVDNQDDDSQHMGSVKEKQHGSLGA